MKQFFAIITACALLAGCQQAPEGYVIKGEVEGASEGMVYLKSFRNKMFFNTDSAEIKEGHFEFSGKVETPLLYGLATEDMRYPAQFFVENKAMNVVLNAEDGSISIQGSPANDIFLENAEKVFEKGYNIDSLVTKYPDSPVAAFYLYRYFTYQLTLDNLKDTRAKLAPTLASCPYILDLDKIITQLENVQIGKVAPEFSLPDTAGVQVSLSSFRGKYLLIDFWAAWCPPCRRENPNVVKAFEDFKDKGFTVLGISLDRDKSQWLKAIADDKLTWTHLSDLKYWDSEIPALYGVRGIPDNVLLNPEGIIIARNITGEALHNKLKEVMP
ncbi:peroxiredoxin [Parabacteroides sp. PF5-5]|uniref:TlpA disulfide reductase family protein n=1 Tax=unclassified Parabacteroides TaxID=2649774 RepID=UPI00247369EB|nr:MULTISPECIES: TlpA disulfide reductase family protein [unclassified Parabacteroides]MDH6305164.1 peroxiredoxin [Parabacteroides sp. PH5-39]MDH6316514.1 peroxiredoxin [Parabacteroides sp. PF5-13]MDH6320024.1 peroxiredoxin [Parabacteroides sp. PH5-13]MDH6323743.1 peroxiredoxin [Parabacteroides sp. PH5-8]MDH6327701.1 peroxiredoxin [Parabacteroides sp. PH5-41]